MSHVETSLYLINRMLRQAAQREALPHEEDTIRSLVAKGVTLEQITKQVNANRKTA